jgi:uncharacterized membrane protein (DUF106 family)|tara:strand:- start:85 stop:234 length:150 start_codon:yes stop_codon:yes gene_type:complete
MNAVIIISVIVGIYYLGKYAIEEGERIERQKKFMKDMEEFDKYKKTKRK